MAQDLKTIKALFSNTILALRMHKMIGYSFQFSRGISPGEALSPKLFNLYLNETLIRTDNILQQNDHICTFSNQKLLMHIEYSADVNFIMQDNYVKKTIVISLENIFRELKFSIKHDKSEITLMRADSDLGKLKKLNSLLDDLADIERKDNLGQLALKKYASLWKTHSLKKPLKYTYTTFP